MNEHYREHLIKNLVRVTLRCNARCIFCNIPPESEPDFIEPSEESLVREVRKAVKKSGGDGIVISGGEPTLRKVFLRAAEEARRAGAPWVEIQTNGLLVDRKMAVSMASAGISKALVAVLSHDDAVHDGLTGVKGSWKKTVRSIHAMHEGGIEIILNLLMTGPTTQSYPRLVKFVLDEFPFVNEVNFSAVSATGRCAQRTDLWPDFDAARTAVKKSLSLAKKKKVRCLNPFCGLPVCAGWEDTIDFCVEAQEMKAARVSGRKLTDIEGLKNEGEKIQPPVCLNCCFRTVCGGIWRKIAEVRGEKGLRPPLKIPRAVFPSAPTPPAGTGKRSALVISLDGRGGVNTLPEVRNILRKEKKRCIMVSFTGPEPTFYDWLPEAARQASREDYQVVQVFTDGKKLSDRSYAEKLVTSGVSEFVIPLWSTNPEMHDDMAGGSGSLRQTLRGIARIMKIRRETHPGPNIVLLSPLVPRTVTELEAFALLCKKLQVSEFFFFAAQPPFPPPPSHEVVARKMNELSERLKAAPVKFYSLGLPPEYNIPSYGKKTIPPLIRYPK